MTTHLTQEAKDCIVDDLIDSLMECEEGTVTTTWCLLKEMGHDMSGFDPLELISIHDMMFEAATGCNIVLDMSAHDNKVEGMPYNLDFIVHNSEAVVKCPYCGSTDTARYLYGYPVFGDDLRKKIEEKKIILGGCEIDPTGNMPRRRCNHCGKDF